MLSDAQLGFFGGFIGFEADRDAAGEYEFARLACQRKWVQGSKTYKKYANAFQRLLSLSSETAANEIRDVKATPKKDRKTAEELTPDWILADVFKHLNIGSKTSTHTLATAKSLDLDDSGSEDDGVVIGYFDKHPSFETNRTAPIQEEFERLAKDRQWRKGSNEFWNEFCMCLDQELASVLKSGSSGLKPLQNLCRDVGAEPLPASNTQCAKVRIYEF